MTERAEDEPSNKAPAVLWVFGVLVTLSLAVVGLGRIAACGARTIFLSCSNLYVSVLPHYVWQAYVAVAFASLALALFAFYSVKNKTRSALVNRVAWSCAAAAIVFSLVAIAALSAFYVLPIVLIHWLVLRFFERRRGFHGALAELSVIFVSWVVSLTIAWAQPLNAWLFNAAQNPNWQFACATLGIILALNIYVLREPREVSAPGFKLGTILWDALALAVFLVLSFRQDSFGQYVSLHHWGFYVGPVELVRQGAWLLWDAPSQYGFLSILAVALMPFASAWTAMYVLDATLLFASACILYVVLRSLRIGRLSIVFSFITASVAVYLLPGVYTQFLGPQFFPSIGAFRFIWVEALVLVLFLNYARGSGARQNRLTILAGSIVWLIGVLWSAESTIYVTVIWIPALFVLMLSDAEGQTLGERLRTLRHSKSTLFLFTPLVLLVAAVVVIHLTYLICLHHGPDYYAFVEFGLSYTNGLGTLPINTFGAVWLLVLAMSICVTGCVLVIKHSANAWRALPLLYAAAAVIWATGSYFVDRSADSNATNIFTPVCLALAVILFVLDRERLQGTGAQYVRFALAAPLAVAAALTLGNGSGMAAMARGVLAYSANIPRLLIPLTPDALALLDRAHVSVTDPIVFDGATLMPERPNVGANDVRAPLWLPANPTVSLTVITGARKLLYFQRFTARRPMEGWYLRTRADVNTCESLDPEYVTSRGYRSVNWDLSWCSIKR